MNDLQEIWQQEANGGELLDELLQNKTFRQSSFQTPLSKLKKNLAVQTWYAAIITVGYLLIIFFFTIWQVQACLLLLVGFNLWAMAKSYSLYKTIDLDIAQANVLTELKKHHHAFKGWEKQSMQAGLLIYPFAAAGGFMLGVSVSSGISPEIWLSDQRKLVMMVVVVAILVPLGYLAAKWMNKVIFGRYINQLSDRINELEAEG